MRPLSYGLVLALAASTPAFAQDEPAKEGTVMAGLAFGLDYRFCCVSQSDKGTAGEGSITAMHNSSFMF